MGLKFVKIIRNIRGNIIKEPREMRQSPRVNREKAFVMQIDIKK
jgi:hypothetical protein